MKSNPILEEVWRIKDKLARGADYDADRFFDNWRAWSDVHLQSGPVARNAGELRRLVNETQGGSDAPAHKEALPKPPV